ncbi:MAG: hypothetical protein GQ524_07570 [Anaerolineales bacterium]|nr:hypothetical protein [Anaerolineales bacterium]
MAIVVKNVFKPPAHPPGEAMAEQVGRSVISLSSNEHLYTETGAPTVIPLFAIPADTFIVDVVLEVSTTYDGTTPVMTIGDGGQADRFMNDTLAALGTAGFKSAKEGATLGAGGHLYTSDDTLDMTWTTGGGASQGAGKVHIFYVRDWSAYQ